MFCRQGIEMPTPHQLRTLLPDIDPSIAIAQSIRQEPDTWARAYERVPKISLGMALLLVATAIASVFLSDSPRQVTATMERFAARLEAAQRIPPETRDAAGKLLALRRYDCEEIKCDEQLRLRSWLVRERLKEAIFGKSVAVSVSD
jgi:hypothetical protein